MARAHRHSPSPIEPDQMQRAGTEHRPTVRFRDPCIDGRTLRDASPPPLLYEREPITFDNRSPTTGVPSPPEAWLRPGELVSGRYRIERALATGAMGRVYVAVQLSTDRLVALKVLLTRHASRPEMRAALEAEGRALCRIQHPNVVTVHDTGVDGDRAWLAMELLEGETLREKLKSGRALPLDQAVRITCSVAAGLHAAHERDILHGDVKPENIFITHKALVKVLDLATAMMLTSAEASTADKPTTFGTPEYVAPERLRPNRVADGRSDLYSLALVFYELVTGRHAMNPDGDKVDRELMVWRQLHYVAAIQPGIPLPIWRVLAKGLEKDPSKRQATVAEFAEDLLRAYRTSTAAPHETNMALPQQRERTRAVLRGALFGSLIGLVFFAAESLVLAWPSQAAQPQQPSRLPAAPPQVPAVVQRSPGNISVSRPHADTPPVAPLGSTHANAPVVAARPSASSHVVAVSPPSNSIASKPARPSVVNSPKAATSARGAMTQPSSVSNTRRPMIY